MGEQHGHGRILIVDEEAEGLRLDVFLAQNLEGVSRSQVKKWIQQKHVLINDTVPKPKDSVRLGDKVSLPSEIPLTASSFHLKPAPMELDIFYEDADLIVLNKAKGLVVHPGAGTGNEPTLVEGILYHLGERAQREGDTPASARPGIVHRLDKDTSGVMVVAKNDKTLRGLAQQFHDKTNLREYVALLDGYMSQDEIVHESYLYRDPGNRVRYASLSKKEYAELGADEGDNEQYRYAKSVFTRHTTYGQRLTLARVRLFTGRTHQIRIHARDLKMSVVGDPVYGKPVQLPSSFPQPVREKLAKVDSQLLHARILGFTHPGTGEKLAFEAPLPQDFREVLGILNDNCR